MDRYQQTLQSLKAKKEGAFIPFVVLGDPGYEESKAIIIELIKAGADGLELSIPFSDPLADGPEIQAATLRAIGNGMTLEKSFQLLAEIRAMNSEIPIGLLMYANLINAYGFERFYQRCQDVGVDSVLVADIPLRESESVVAIAAQYNIAPIFICPPDATDETVQKIAQFGKGYTYLVSRAGVTGIDRSEEDQSLENNITRLKKAGAPPIIQGFGISTPAQVTRFMANDIAGVISGSAVTKLIRENLGDMRKTIEAVGDFTKMMKAATR